MGLAQQAWREAQMDQVREHLQVAEPRRPGDPDLRGFEWYYLRRLCDASTRTLRGHTGMVTCVAYSPDGRRVVSAGIGGRDLQDLGRRLGPVDPVPGRAVGRSHLRGVQPRRP